MHDSQFRQMLVSGNKLKNLYVVEAYCIVGIFCNLLCCKHFSWLFFFPDLIQQHPCTSYLLHCSAPPTQTQGLQGMKEHEVLSSSFHALAQAFLLPHRPKTNHAPAAYFF